MQIISQEKILPWGLMVLRESDLNGYYSKGVLFTFWKRVGFEGVEKETDLLVHAHWTISLLSSISSLFFSVFLSYLFFFFSFYSVFLFTLFFFLLRECSVFQSLPQGTARSFYSACCGRCFTILPLNCLCLVWAYLPTTKSVRHSPLPDKGRFVSFLSLP